MYNEINEVSLHHLFDVFYELFFICGGDFKKSLFISSRLKTPIKIFEIA